MPRELFNAEVLSCEPCAQDTMRLVLKAEKLARELCAGQFMNLAVAEDASQLLRIPLSYARTNTQTGSIELIFAVVGTGTRALGSLQAGQTVSVLGPLGHGWELPHTFGHSLLVAGGVGLPPIVAAAEMLVGAGMSCDVVVGAKTSTHLVVSELDRLETQGFARIDCTGSPDFLSDVLVSNVTPSLSRIFVCTDDGSAGFKGFTTTFAELLMAKTSYTALYSCGPQTMMKKLATLGAATQLETQVSLERMMACGFGVCGCCNVESADGTMLRCCVDGPVMDARKVLW